MAKQQEHASNAVTVNGVTKQVIVPTAVVNGKVQPDMHAPEATGVHQ